MKILTIVGARPQFVKAAVLSRTWADDPNIEEILVHTGQHFDANMSEVFFREMEIPHPKYNLNINSMNHGAMTGKMLAGIEELILEEKPDLLLVYGDTNSTLAGALAARKLHVKVCHVEAGLRSFNMQMPEEVNRILSDRISDILFCPTDSAVSNLENEGFANFDAKIVKSGDVMQDAALHYAERSADKAQFDFDLPDGDFVLTTLHRAENTDDQERLSEIVSALNAIHEKMPVVLPLHPRTRNILDRSELNLNVHTVAPMGYFEMIACLKKCRLVMTDSGGLQKEAYFFGKNCVTLRDQTEWVELVDGGYNILARADRADILGKFDLMKNRDNTFTTNLYGGGEAGKTIHREILKCFDI